MAGLSNFTAKQRPTKVFKFPKRRFGSKCKERSFCAEWCDAFSWLHHDVATLMLPSVVITAWFACAVRLRRKFLVRDPALLLFPRGLLTLNYQVLT